MSLSGRPASELPNGDPAPLEPSAPARPKVRVKISRLTLRILAINVLALAILVGGILYLVQYQDQLIESRLESLKGEAKLFAASVAENSVQVDVQQHFTLAPGRARSFVGRLFQEAGIPTRLYDGRGALIADSNQIVGPNGAVIEVRPLPPPRKFQSFIEIVVARVSRMLESWPGRARLPVYAENPASPTAANPDLKNALAGDISATAWLDADGHLLLTAAAPVQHYKLVLGAVVLNRDGIQIEQAIESTVMDIAKVSGVAVAVTVLLSLYLASAISRPIRRLAAAAERLRMGGGRSDEIPDFTNRRDEIGELSLALRDMTQALKNRMEATERFAADVAHELKNPLSSLSSAVETLERVEDPAQRKRLQGIVHHDVKRLDRLISDISNASRLDAELSRAESQPVDLWTLLSTLAEIHAIANENRKTAEAPVLIALDVPQGLVVRGVESRLGQVFQNLISNAVSFSPPGGTVSVSAARDAGVATVSVTDQGPGIPPGKLEAVFGRFYSERPSGEAFGTHSGLGLSIARQIVESLGGRIHAENRIDESGRIVGARFVVQMPLA